MYLKAAIILLQGWLLCPGDRSVAKPLQKFGASNKIALVVSIVRGKKKKLMEKNSYPNVLPDINVILN